MGYYIKKLPEHDINKYRYSYLDHLETIIDLRDNYWDFDMQLYIINDASVPLNSYTMDMQMPYQEISDICFNLAADQEGVKERVDGNNDYAKLFESKFLVDVSKNEYLKQDLSHAKLNCVVNLQIDPEVMEKAGFDPGQEALDGFVNETGEQKVIFDLDYSNYYEVNKDGELSNNYGFSLARHSSTCFSRIRLINVQSNDYSDNKKAINHLTSIQCDDKFQVLVGKVKFYYWLDLQEGQTLEFDLDLDKQETNLINIDLNQKTIFDYENNKVLVDPCGINGFYIPKYSWGYYELTLKIFQDGNIHTFVIKNNFAFKENISKPYMAMQSIVINDLAGFNEVIW